LFEDERLQYCSVTLMKILFQNVDICKIVASIITVDIYQHLD